MAFFDIIVAINGTTLDNQQYSLVKVRRGVILFPYLCVCVCVSFLRAHDIVALLRADGCCQHQQKYHFYGVQHQVAFLARCGRGVSCRWVCVTLLTPIRLVLTAYRLHYYAEKRMGWRRHLGAGRQIRLLQLGL